MGRKIRTGALLILVLAMIYTQQAVIYAQNEAEKNMKKTTESDNSDGTNGEDKEQEKPGGEEEDKDKEPEQPEIKRYELEIPKADGKNGYYLSKPSVMITHNGAYGTTVYELKHGEDTLLQGRIKYIVSQEAEEQKTKISLEGEVFEEGKNILHVFMEDEEGNVIPEYDETIEILIDTQSPTVTLEAPEGFSTWYQKEAWIRVVSEDGAWGSQVDTVTCYVGNKIIGKSKENQSEFLITQTSKSGEGVPVTVTVTDQAGNKTEKTQKLFIDSLAPTVSLTGAADYLITSQPVTLEYQATDENKLESCRAVIDYEKPEGEKKTEVIDSEEKWSLENESASLVKTFQEDGIYKTSVQAVDKAKQKSEHFLQFMIDTKNPVIKMVDELQGKYLKKFSWDYPVDVFIKDFTTFVHQIQMDGRLYPIGTELTVVLGAAAVFLLLGLSAVGPLPIFLFAMLYGTGSGLLSAQLLNNLGAKQLVLFLLTASLPTALAAGALCLFGASALQVSSRIHAFSFGRGDKGSHPAGARLLVGQFALLAVCLCPLCGAATGLVCLANRLMQAG